MTSSAGETRTTDDWRKDAGCLGSELDWFPIKLTRYIRDQQQTCADCAVTDSCAQAAIDHNDQYGIRAGIFLDPSRTTRSRRQLALIAAGEPVAITAPERPPAPTPRPAGPLKVKRQPTIGQLARVLTDDEVRAMRAYRAAGTKVAYLAKVYGVSSSAVSMICLGIRRPEAGGWLMAGGIG